MKLILDLPVRSLDGTKVEGGTLGQLLATQLMMSNEGDAIKFYEWALKMNRNESIEIDKSDYNMLKTFVEKSKTLTNLAKAQILNCIYESDSKSNHVPKKDLKTV